MSFRSSKTCSSTCLQKNDVERVLRKRDFGDVCMDHGTRAGSHSERKEDLHFLRPICPVNRPGIVARSRAEDGPTLFFVVVESRKNACQPALSIVVPAQAGTQRLQRTQLGDDLLAFL